MRSRVGDCLVIRSLSVKRGLNGRCAISFSRYPGDADTCVFTPAVIIKRDTCRHANDGETRRGVMHLDVSVTRPATAFVDANLTQYLARAQVGRHQIDKEIVCADRTLAILAGGHKFGVESNRCRGPITGRIGMGQAAANRSLVSHLYVANMPGAFR